MRQLTLKGFLHDYVLYLSESNTLSVHKLVQEMYNGNYRLKEPLFLYCCHFDKIELMLKYLQPQDCAELKVIAAVKNQNDLSLDYQKVYRAYEYQANKFGNKTHVKKLMRDKILEMQKQLSVSTYRLHKDLKINASNLNDFLKNGNLNKLKLEKVEAVFNYLESMCSS